MEFIIASAVRVGNKNSAVIKLQEASCKREAKNIAKSDLQKLHEDLVILDTVANKMPEKSDGQYFISIALLNGGKVTVGLYETTASNKMEAVGEVVVALIKSGDGAVVSVAAIEC